MMEGYPMIILLSLTLLSSLPPAPAEKNSHFFFTTITNDSSYNYPSYCTVRSLNDVTLYWYDSDSGVIERRVPWFKTTVGNLLTGSIAEYRFQRTWQKHFEEFRNYTNDTEGFQVLQLLDGCNLNDDGTYDTIFSFQYNGSPFLSFDVENGTWTADHPRAQVFSDKFNNDKNMSKEYKSSLKDACVPHIAELLSLGECTFNRKEQPVVVVTLIPLTDSTSRLHCRAYGHYPKNISMMWYKNGQPVSESLMERVTLPLPDITYLTWLSMNTTQADDDVYFCVVTHSSMESPLVTRISGDSPVFYSANSANIASSGSNTSDGGIGISIGGIVGICLAIVVLMILTIFGVVWWTGNRTR